MSSKPGKHTWILDTSRDWDRRVQGFREHIAIDGSVKGVSGRDAACGWEVVHLDHDKEEEPWYATYDSSLHHPYLQSGLC